MRNPAGEMSCRTRIKFNDAAKASRALIFMGGSANAGLQGSVKHLLRIGESINASRNPHLSQRIVFQMRQLLDVFQENPRALEFYVRFVSRILMVHVALVKLHMIPLIAPRPGFVVAQRNGADPTPLAGFNPRQAFKLNVQRGGFGKLFRDGLFRRCKYVGRLP